MELTLKSKSVACTPVDVGTAFAGVAAQLVNNIGAQFGAQGSIVSGVYTKASKLLRGNIRAFKADFAALFNQKLNSDVFVHIVTGFTSVLLGGLLSVSNYTDCFFKSDVATIE